MVEATPVAGPSTFFLQLDLTLANGTTQSILSSDGWRADSGDAVVDLGPIEAGLNVPASRRVGIDAVDNYEQWKQALGAQDGTDPAAFSIAPGFEIRLVRTAQPGEDSWVSMVFDPQGRLLIGKEKQGLLRMRLSDDGNQVDEVETIDDSLLECRGLAFIGDDLYVNANNSKAMYRLPKSGDTFAKPESVFASSGGVGHGRNDLVLGPDGLLYSIHGDAVDLPTDVADYTSPFREARRGKKTSEGYLLRVDPASGTGEVLAAGLRNPFGIDFNGDGEVFTYDADAEYDMGSPWYRPTRVSHLVTGADYGWRGVTKSWPPYYPDHPDNAQPNLDIGKGSPTAVKFGTRSHFPEPYRDALFILDWAYGRIIAVHMIPRGSSYLMASETFLKGRPLNVTDLDFGPDGSMYLVTGGRKTQSALYRIRFVGKHPVNDRLADGAVAARHLRRESAAESRKLRRQLEAELANEPTADRIDRVWNHLSNPDPWIRRAAINIIERHPIDDWSAKALSETEPTPAVLTLLSLDRAGRDDLLAEALRRLNEWTPQLARPSDRLAAFYAYWLTLQKLSAIDKSLRSETTRVLSAEYPANSYPHDRLLSEMLIKLEAIDAVPKTIALLNSSGDQAAQMHYLYVLRNARDGWTLADRQDFFAGLARAEHYLGGAGMNDFLKRIREEAIGTLTEKEREQLSAELEPRGSTSEPIEYPTRQLVRQWTVKELALAESPSRDPDPVRGSEIFAQASCIQCHRFGARGTLIGPDLTAASRRFSRHDLLVAMIEPSKVIAENYRSLQIVTVDGQSHVGQATLGGDYRSPVLRLATNPRKPFETIEIAKTEIESQTYSDVSWMPAGLLDTFTRAEIEDLIAYLQSK